MIPVRNYPRSSLTAGVSDSAMAFSVAHPFRFAPVTKTSVAGSVTTVADAMTGSGTSFSTALAVGDAVWAINGGKVQIRTVLRVIDNTDVLIDRPFEPDLAAASIFIGEPFFITVIEGTTFEEIVAVVETTGPVFTVVRAQGGTVAQTFTAGALVQQRTTAELLEENIGALAGHLLEYLARSNGGKKVGQTLVNYGTTTVGEGLLAVEDTLWDHLAATAAHAAADITATATSPLTGDDVQEVLDSVPTAITAEVNAHASSSPAHAANQISFSPVFGVTATDVQAAIASLAGNNFTTGDIKPTVIGVAATGWLVMDDTTIGNTGSGATHAGPQYENLFKTLWQWVADAWAPVSGGRGPSEDVDWANNKTIQILTVLGRTLGAAGAGAGLTARAAGQYVGEEQHTILEAEMPSHYHYQLVVNTSASWPEADDGNNYPLRQFGPADNGFYELRTSSDDGDPTHGISGETGGDDPHNNMQPSFYVYFHIKL